MLTMGETAELYMEKLGWSVIPVGKNKKSLIDWKKYQNVLPTNKEIKAWWKTYPKANIAAITGKISNLAVIDIDDITEKLNVDRLIPKGLKFPISKTPSGLHYLFTCPDDTLTNKCRAVAGSDVRANGGYILIPPSESEKGIYEWEVKPSQVQRPPFPSPYLTVIQNIQINNYIATHHQLFQDGSRDEDLFHAANCLMKGGMLSSRIEQIVNILALHCKPPFPPEEAKKKVESVILRTQRKEHNWQAEIEQWIDQAEGYFKTQDIYGDLGAVSKADKSAVRTSLNRLVNEGKLQRNSKTQGSYRKIEVVCETIDYESADEAPFDIKYPFKLEKYFETYPKNIIVVAGEPDAGKTALLLNIAEMNLGKHPVMYFSSEMGKGELRRRLDLFDRDLTSWKKEGFVVKDRSENFADVIEPDAINIIDYMEIHDNFWQIGGWIKQVFDKLNKGVAIIAIQREKGKSAGRGGLATLEKPRLYLNVGHGEIDIIKCKNWAMSGVNPKDMKAKFRLVKGCHFIVDEDWTK